MCKKAFCKVQWSGKCKTGGSHLKRSIAHSFKQRNLCKSIYQLLYLSMFQLSRFFAEVSVILCNLPVSRIIKHFAKQGKCLQPTAFGVKWEDRRKRRYDTKRNTCYCMYDCWHFNRSLLGLGFSKLPVETCPSELPRHAFGVQKKTFLISSSRHWSLGDSIWYLKWQPLMSLGSALVY